MARVFARWDALCVALVLGVICGARADWTVTRTLPAAEAHQAAAADDQFVYAISSTQVAKYERVSGEKVATSSGPAKHLNSGFIWNGRLYCAHSNYPQVPEQSEIKVLDLASMQLTTFKDFGNFGGSLTWAIVRDGHWWCNFARYGTDNAGTFMVKLTPDWQEVGRWTLPPELVARLGRYSLSGGIWQGDELLVTGHDDPLLFQLRLPASGTVLKYVRTENIPFTGQGIAADPVSRGLIGIQRAKRQLVFAESDEPRKSSLRVLSYNIHHGEGTDGKLDLERIAGVIRSAEPDVVALQEVDQKVQRTGGVDQPAELARLTGMQVVFGPNIPLQGGHYGNAVLSRFPLGEQKNHRLPNLEMGEQRGVMQVEIQVPSLEQPLVFLATHLDHRRDDRERRESATMINELSRQLNDRTLFLAGDLNAMPDSPVLAEFAKVWKRSNDAAVETSPAGKPTRQIDYVLNRASDPWRPVETKVLDEPSASDHRPILAVFEKRLLNP